MLNNSDRISQIFILSLYQFGSTLVIRGWLKFIRLRFPAAFTQISPVRLKIPIGFTKFKRLGLV